MLRQLLTAGLRAGQGFALPSGAACAGAAWAGVSASIQQQQWPSSASVGGIALRGMATKPISNGYNLFVSEEFAEVKGDKELKHSKDVIKEIASMWKALPEHKQQEYKDRAAKNNKPVLAAKAKAEAERKQGAKAKVTGYQLYLQEALPGYRTAIQKQDPDVKFTEVFRQAAKGWSALSGEDKAKYNAAAVAKREEAAAEASR